MTCVGGWTQIAGTWPALSSRGGEVKGVEEEREGGYSSGRGQCYREDHLVIGSFDTTLISFHLTLDPSGVDGSTLPG